MKLHKTSGLAFSVAAVCLFGLVSCADFFQGKVPMQTSKEGLSSLYDLLTPQTKITALDAPKELHVSAGLYAGKIEISWSKVPYATSYQLERAVVKEPQPDGTWKLPDESDFEVLMNSRFVFDTSYTDTILRNPLHSSVEANYRYYYRVFARNSAKGYEPSPYYPDYEVHKIKDENGNVTGEEVYADPSIYGCLFKSPSNVEADKGKSTDSVNVGWTAVDGAAKYRIFRGEKENDSDSVFLGEVLGNETSYENKMLPVEQGVDFYYKVYAVNANGELSPASALAMGYSLVEGAPAAPGNVRVEDGLGTSKSSVKVKWDEVSGTGDITYSLYRTSSSDSSYKLLKKSLTTAEFEDKTAAAGLYYYYFVQTVSVQDDVELKSSFSESGKDSKNPAYAFLLSPPSSVEVSDSEKGSDFVRVRWKPAINALDGDRQIDFSYNIRTDSSFDGYFGTIVLQETKGEKDDDGWLFADIERSAASDYFVVSTVNAGGTDKESRYSAVVAPVPDAPANVFATKTVGVTTASARVSSSGGTLDEEVWRANNNGVYPVLVTWSESGKAAGYDVYRSTKADSGFKKINDAPLTDLYYVDAYTAAKAGVFYYYKVFALNSLGQGTKSNNPADDKNHDARGYGALTREQWFREYNKDIKSSQKKIGKMNVSSDTDKIGTDFAIGAISGRVDYETSAKSLVQAAGGLTIYIRYKNYADHAMPDDETKGYFILDGEANTKITDVTKQSGNMENTVNVTGMYPGSAVYNSIVIKGGAAGGGTYGVLTKDLDGNVVFDESGVDWKIGEE